MASWWLALGYDSGSALKKDSVAECIQLRHRVTMNVSVYFT